MRKFIINVAIFTVIIIVVTAAINFAYVKMNESDPNGIEKFSSVPDHIQICNFGSSHGFSGYNYADVEDQYNCFNFGLSAQSLSYDYRLFLNYGDRIEKGAVVFINVSYFSLFGKGEESEDNFESKNQRYYTILPKDLIKQYSFTTDICVRYLPVLGADTDSLIETFSGKNKNSESIWQRMASDIDVLKDAQEAYDRHIVTDNFDDEGIRIVDRQEVKALCDLIEACREKGAIPILITTPYLKEYTSEVENNDPDFYSDFYSVINQVTESTGVDYYDYAFDERFANKYDWFMNCDHLNEEGARVFVDILIDETVYGKGYY